MADQQETYQAAMKEAANAAWEQDWERAITAYRRASQAAPQDSQALAGLALSLMEAGHYDEAIRSYEQVSELVPGDPLPHEKMATTYEIMGRMTEAGKQYLAAAEIYFARKDTDHAVPHWERAVQLNPDLAQAHMRLAVLYERDKETQPQAIFSYLSLARLLQQYNQTSRAEQVLKRAMSLNPTDNDVRAAVDNLKQGKPIPPVDPANFVVRAQPQPQALPIPVEEDDDLFTADIEEVAGRTPADDAARHAMSLLADLVWSGDVPPAAQTAVVQAIDLHQVGDAAGAIALYKQAEAAGLDHPALRFNLGLLYQFERRHPEAIDLLTQAVEAPEYATAGHLALGQLYLLEGEFRQAARHLVEALREADRQINETIDEAGYDRLKASLTEQAIEQLTELSKGIAAYLDDIHWQDKLRDTRAGYTAQGKTRYVSELVELVIEGGRPEVAEIMEHIDLYLKQGMLRLAMEEAQYAIEKAPDYLPAHRRLADVLIKDGRTQSAAEKINLIANTYIIRGNGERAADLFAEVLTIWPTDMVARQQVLDMLIEQGRVNEVLHHYAEMADQYNRVRFDQNKAIEIYNKALAYGEKHDAAPKQMIVILKALADIESQRLNWNEALKYYDRCRGLAPGDDEVTMDVIKLHFQMGDTSKAIAALDEYIQQCIADGTIERIISTLESLVRMYQNEVSLRQRLSDVYHQQGRVPEAIAQMDAIGEMLLEAGRIDEATAVIRKIIELNPPDIEGYRQLLAQLESSGT